MGVGAAAVDPLGGISKNPDRGRGNRTGAFILDAERYQESCDRESSACYEALEGPVNGRKPTVSHAIRRLIELHRL